MSGIKFAYLFFTEWGMGHWALGIGHWAQEAEVRRGRGEKLTAPMPLCPMPHAPCPISTEPPTGCFAGDTWSGLYPGVRLLVRHSSNA